MEKCTCGRYPTIQEFDNISDLYMNTFEHKTYYALCACGVRGANADTYELAIYYWNALMRREFC